MGHISLLTRSAQAGLISLLLLLSSLSAHAQTNTWTGGTDTDWNTAANWSLTLVSTATHNVVIPSAPANKPILSTAASASSVHVQSGASLTISSAGSLTINSFATLGGFTNAFYNQGTVTNGGTVILGNTAPVGSMGLWSDGTFTNTGTIQISRATDHGINNRGAFAHSGTITIGASATVGEQGIWNQATFTNSGGSITIDRTGDNGLRNDGTFTNSATLTIGASAFIATRGVLPMRLRRLSPTVVQAASSRLIAQGTMVLGTMAPLPTRPL